MGSCPSLGWQQRLFLGHLATGCPQRKCLGNSKHQVPLGSSTRTNLALGPNQCLARWWHARAEWEFKQPGETTLRIGGREDATMLDALFITTNVKTKDPGAANIRFPTKKDREIQVKG